MNKINCDTAPLRTLLVSEKCWFLRRGGNRHTWRKLLGAREKTSNELNPSTAQLTLIILFSTKCPLVLYVETFYFCMCVIWYLFVCLFFRNELLKTRQLAVTKLFNLLKLSTDDTTKYVCALRSHFLFTLLFFSRAIFVWPWHENARTKQEPQERK